MSENCTEEQFRKDIANHAMHTLRDDGLYRHLRFKQPQSSCYCFDIVTWPGYLAITGDMGASVFSRLSDMFEFFRPGRGEESKDDGLFINRGYWAEKLQANDGSAKEFSLERFRANIGERFNSYFEGEELTRAEREAKRSLWRQVREELIEPDWDHEVRAYDAVHEFEPEDQTFKCFGFPDFWESNNQEYTFHFTWRCYAIAHAIQHYDALALAKSAPAHGVGR